MPDTTEAPRPMTRPAPQPAAQAPASASRPVRFRGGGFVAEPRRWAALLAFVIAIAAWEASGRLRLVSPLFLPPPSAILLALQGLVADGSLARNLAASLMRIGVGWTLGTAAGVLVGFAMGIWSIARAIGLPAVSALFPIPKIALLPLFILWLGIGEASKFATIGLGVFFPTVIATYSAVDGVPRNLIRMGQSFNMPWLDVLRKVVLPGAMPGILAGFRISASIALILVVSAEMIGADYGIGAFVLNAGNLMLTDQLLAGVLVLSLLGLAIGTALSLLEKTLLKWR
ncbi:ABC transporter permease [Arenibaculum pallidiluteum]|uniref:ABC transporter permease n=1 Tax=Arenibaculum pallidiluteum TaxID=2812559 RepID=UPI002E2ADBFB|nr:ABC transporter permease [Arenibaculum pallidiluteum]